MKEKFHSGDSPAMVFFPMGPVGKGEGHVILGPIQAVSALPVLRDSRDLNPGYPTRGTGVVRICPVFPGRSFQPEQEDRG